MKKTTALVFYVFVCITSLTAQGPAPTWFKISDMGFDDEEGGVIAVDEHNFYYDLIWGINYTVPHTQNCVVKYDSMGQIVWRTFLPYPASTKPDSLIQLLRDLIYSKDQHLYVASHIFGEVNYEVLIHKINTAGEIIWQKSYGLDNESVMVGFYGLTPAVNGNGLIIAGRTTTAYPNRRLLVMRIDSTGTLLWKRLYTIPPNHAGHSIPVVQMPNGDIKIAFDNGWIADFKDYWISLDSLGNEQLLRKSAFNESCKDLALHPNGNLVYLSEEDEAQQNQKDGMRTHMLTPDFDTLWTRLFYDYDPPYYFIRGSARNISIAPDGKILVSGFNTMHCALVCYSPTGEMLWTREVVMPDELGNCTFNYACWSDDGRSILLDGILYGINENGNTDSRKTFFIKLSDVGCLTPGCAQTILTSTKDDRQTGVKEFSVMPNPTHGPAQILSTDNNTDYTIRIFDNAGRLIHEEFQPEPVTTFDLGTQPPGIYHILFYKGDGRILTEKIVKI